MPDSFHSSSPPCCWAVSSQPCLPALLADWLGRKKMMTLSGILFVISIPMIALAHGYEALVFGRLLQGISAGLIGVVVPLYLAECLGAAHRGKGTGIFQWLLTLGIVAAAVIGLYFSNRVDEVAKLGDADKLFAFKDHAWRSIFWVSLPPGILFVIGSFMVAESPRWLFRRGKKDAARAALLRSRSEAQAEIELQEMADTAAAEKAGIRPDEKSRNPCCAANTSSRLCWPASSSPATSSPASTPSSATTRPFSFKPAWMTGKRTWVMSFSRWLIS